ncbi:hypothetical protein DSL72_002578 [Monilinia vaccinii-corymbosi]|uniref:Uncharacterized protein n=1 Tax=Monilinia vaccinii-corymbosi TaxID=61207 RepID=A0A8A3PD22_9HELO|nr:hypothetical protein DSL72_002578 [Monilinia vaccinii-corymbosi]
MASTIWKTTQDTLGVVLTEPKEVQAPITSELCEEPTGNASCDNEKRLEWNEIDPRAQWRASFQSLEVERPEETHPHEQYRGYKVDVESRGRSSICEDARGYGDLLAESGGFPLVQVESHPAHDSQNNRKDHAPGRPREFGPPRYDANQQRAQGADEDEAADPVNAFLLVMKTKKHDHNDHRNPRNRQIQIENPPPIGRRQRTAQDRSQHRRHRSRRQHHAQIFPSLPQRNNVAYDQLDQHHDASRSQALHRAPRDQHRGRGRASGNAAPEHKQRDRHEHGRAAPEYVAELRAERLDHRLRDEEAICDPDVAVRGREIIGDFWEGARDHGAVEGGDEGEEGEGEEDEIEAPGFGGIGCGFFGRCKQFAVASFTPAGCKEEHERELSPETRREQQVELPPPLTPCPYIVHTDECTAVSDKWCAEPIIQSFPASLPDSSQYHGYSLLGFSVAS